jgi:two-component system response regulator DegU
MTPISILIVDDHTLFRQGLRRIFEAKAGFNVVGEAKNGEEAVELAWQLKPDVILMDVDMPEVDGIQATRLIIENDPEARVIMLTVHQKEHWFFDSMKAGARGYLLKDIHWHELLEAIKVVYHGGILIDPALADSISDEFHYSI